MAQVSCRPLIELGLLAELTPEELDELPFGVIQLDRQGVVLTFNRYEEALAHKKRADVLWKNFFEEVAPCARVKEFHGRFLEGVRLREMNVTFGFVFPFKEEQGPRHVDVTLFYRGADDTVWVIVRNG